jgi:hypothetical protein
MRKCLLSIDWDFFIDTQKVNWGSYAENTKTIIDLWYKWYFQSKARGKNIQKIFELSLDVDKFWEKIKKIFLFEKDLKAYVSDSHVLSYFIAKKNACRVVYLVDAHADLGYGDLSSLNLEVNCANWLGKLLKNKQIEEANIIYSPFTAEKPEDFKSLNNSYNIKYPSLKALGEGLKVSAIHICRSGAWTPPWFDQKFRQFINKSGIPYKIIDCPLRKWDTKNVSFADQIDYLLA